MIVAELESIAEATLLHRSGNTSFQIIKFKILCALLLRFFALRFSLNDNSYNFDYS